MMTPMMKPEHAIGTNGFKPCWYVVSSTASQDRSEGLAR